MSEKECTFCDIVEGKVSTEKIYEDDFFLSILAKSPTPLGHSIVIPKHHVLNFSDLSREEQLDFAAVWGLVEIALVTLLKKPRAINLKSGGFVNHFHLHLYTVDEDASWPEIIGMFENRVNSNPSEKDRQNLLKSLRQQLNYKTLT